MGDLNRAALEEALRFRLGNRTDIATQLTNAIQFAYNELATTIRIPETQESATLTLQESIATYAQPTNLFFPVSLRNLTEGERLVPKTIRDYDRERDTITAGKPTHYVWWRNELIFFPTPDATVRLIVCRYLKRLDPLTLATNTPVLPREWDEVIIQGGYFRLLRWMQRKDEAQVEFAEYTSMISRRLDRIAESFYDHEDSAKPKLVERTR